MASEAEVEAGAKALCEIDVPGSWETMGPVRRGLWLDRSRAALEAAERVRGEDDHVVLINKSSTDMAVCRLDCNGEPYGPGIIIRHGRELVIRKAVK